MAQRRTQHEPLLPPRGTLCPHPGPHLRPWSHGPSLVSLQQPKHAFQTENGEAGSAVPRHKALIPWGRRALVSCSRLFMTRAGTFTAACTAPAPLPSKTTPHHTQAKAAIAMFVAHRRLGLSWTYPVQAQPIRCSLFPWEWASGRGTWGGGEVYKCSGAMGGSVHLEPRERTNEGTSTRTGKKRATER